MLGDALRACRNAYIMIAVHGGGYCSSAVLAAKTVLTNALRVAGVDTFAVILLWLGKARIQSWSSQYTTFARKIQCQLSLPECSNLV